MTTPSLDHNHHNNNGEPPAADAADAPRPPQPTKRPPPKESPYEPGVWIVNGSETWKVGKRYTLIKQIGSGSFGEVCLARDTRNDDLVAMKRISDISADSYQCRKTLREVCILRRLSHHPNICRLIDCFTTPSDKGRRAVVDGKLVALSLDCYLIFEYADGGDLLSNEHLLDQKNIKNILTQVLAGLNFLHVNGVLHRDIKSANVLMVDGVAKICDFGCARSAAWKPVSFTNRSLSPSIPLNELDSQNENNDQTTPVAAAAAAAAAPEAAAENGDNGDDDDDGQPPRPQSVPPPQAAATTSSADGASSHDDLRARQQKMLRRQMTKTVATPCYRAPEVVMLHDGNYTFEVDIWGVGCIFAELLQREKTAYPVPLFNAVTTGEVHEPITGQRYARGSEQELDAIFDVIGTPPWRYAESIPSDLWRNYLSRIPGHPGTLMENYSSSGTLAFDLLNRMLALDPERRIMTEEALHHIYLADQDAPEQVTHASAAAGWARLRRDKDSAKTIERKDSDGALGTSADGTTPIDALAGAKSAAKTKGSHDVAHEWFSIENPSIALACLEQDLDNNSLTSSNLKDHVAYMQECLKRECEAHAFRSMGFFFGEKPRWWKTKGYHCGDFK
mmetsp:Transcript_7668/g.20114  ORF Transcript_7668/g.20114 Transcript_7668/m.20114 type:complete len:619 (+) Transcript_7668:248-2104(+)